AGFTPATMPCCSAPCADLRQSGTACWWSSTTRQLLNRLISSSTSDQARACAVEALFPSDRPRRSKTTPIPLPACFSKPSGNGSAPPPNLAKLIGSPSEKQELTISKTSTCACLSACGPASPATPEQEKTLWSRKTFTKA